MDRQEAKLLEDRCKPSQEAKSTSASWGWGEGAWVMVNLMRGQAATEVHALVRLGTLPPDDCN